MELFSPRKTSVTTKHMTMKPNVHCMSILRQSAKAWVPLILLDLDYRLLSQVSLTLPKPYGCFVEGSKLYFNDDMTDPDVPGAIRVCRFPHNQQCQYCPMGKYGKDAAFSIEDFANSLTANQRARDGSNLFEWDIAENKKKQDHKYKQCVVCPTGYFSASIGSTECDPCPAGKNQSEVGKMYCDDVPKNKCG